MGSTSLVPPVVDVDHRRDPSRTHCRDGDVHADDAFEDLPQVALDGGKHGVEAVAEIGVFPEHLLGRGHVAADAGFTWAIPLTGFLPMLAVLSLLFGSWPHCSTPETVHCWKC